MASPHLVPVDLRSDTVTRPTPAMRRAMAEAEVGDDVYGEDPTAARLESRIAELLGLEAGLFVPSGSMGNQLAIALHTRPGDEVIVGAQAHPVLYECGAAAALSGVSLLETAGHFFSGAELASRVRPTAYYMPHTKMVAFENTHNRSGGRVWPRALREEALVEAHRHGLATHLDGARLWNASVATGESLEALARGMHSATVCLSKGLGAPVGSVLAGSRAFVEAARRLRKMWGGGMRQVGILAAAGLFALDHEWPRVAEDHRRARAFAEAIEGVAGFRVDLRLVETNIVNVACTFAAESSRAVAALREHGVFVSSLGPGELRVVFHRDVDDAGLTRATQGFRAVGEAFASERA